MLRWRDGHEGSQIQSWMIPGFRRTDFASFAVPFSFSLSAPSFAATVITRVSTTGSGKYTFFRPIRGLAFSANSHGLRRGLRAAAAPQLCDGFANPSMMQNENRDNPQEQAKQHDDEENKPV